MILVTGGTGAMGSVLVRELANRNHKIRIVCLPNDPFVSRIKDCGCEIRYADISNKQELVDICKDIDTVYHLAAIIITKNAALFERINVQGTRNIVDEAIKYKVKHFVHISSASVLYSAPTPYSLSKRKGEDIVKNSSLPYTIIRPTLVYGKTGGQEFDMYLNYLTKYPFVPFIGNGEALKRPVFVDDIMQGLIALCGNTKAIGKTYNFSGSEALSILEFSKLCMRCMGISRKPIVHVPVWLCLMIARVVKLFISNPTLTWQTIAGIIQDANLDPGEAIRDIGYAPVSVTNKLPEMFPRYCK